MIHLYKLDFVLPSAHHPVSPLTSDKGIMDEALKLSLFEKEELCLFNLARFCCKEIFLSDLTNGSTSCVTHQFLEEKELPSPREHKWPSVAPSKKSFNLWCLLLQYILASDRRTLTQIDSSRRVISWARQEDLCIFYPSHPHQCWFCKSVRIVDKICIISAILGKKSIFVVGGFFFPDRSALIWAA